MDLEVVRPYCHGPRNHFLLFSGSAPSQLCCVSSILKARDKAANNMEINQVRISDLNKDVLAGRIKEECWQIMSEPGALSVAGFSCMI